MLSQGPDLPEGSHTDAPCAALVKDDVVFFADDRAHVFDGATFAEAPGMPFRAMFAACGAATDPTDGSRMVVVAGGVHAKRGDIQVGLSHIGNVVAFQRVKINIYCDLPKIYLSCH